jgi:hypothetical protein
MTGDPVVNDPVVDDPVADDPVVDDTARRFQLGIAGGQFPQPAEAPADGVMVTTGSSTWLGIRCRTCNQTFRRGDRVRRSGLTIIQHLDPRLHCASEEPGDATPAPGGDDVRRFTGGLLREWPPLDDVFVVTLTEEDWQVTRPRSGPASPACPGCGHTFRAGDAVIICPCGRAAPDGGPACGLAVHRDPAIGLACWDDWRPDGRLPRCPRTHEKLPG